MKIMKGLRAGLFVLAAAGVVPAHAQQFCSSVMLQGEYTLRISGQILAGPLAGPDNGISLLTFDGNGNFTSQDHVVLNGAQPAVEWRQGSGTYVVNPDCTGKFTVNLPIPPGPLVSYFIITNNRQQLDIVVGNPGINVTAVATRR